MIFSPSDPALVSRTVQLFIHVYLDAQTAVDADGIHRCVI